ncbi:hypothetical protein OAU13_00810 [bacterium]|nr:hypothetical protein [bacterium]
MAKQRNDSLARALGQEPVFSEPTKSNLVEALNWYNYNSEDADYKSWLRQYLNQQGWSKSDIAKATSGSIPRAIAAIARMESRGVATGESARVLSFATNAISTSTYVEEEETVQPSNVISIRDRLEQSCTPYVAWIDQQIDNFIAGNEYDDNFYDYLNGQGCKAAHARVIRDEFEFDFNEMKLLKKGDPAVAECYDGYGKKTQKVLIAFYEKLEADLNQLEQTKKAARVRKVRKPSVEKMLSKVKYCKESTEFKVGSIHPQKIIGGEQLWVFNTKTRQLGRYNGSNFQFKRSSLVNFDADASVCKKLRKPEEFLKVVMSASKSQLNKQFDAIKAVAKPMNGRFNEFNVLLRVW